MPAIKDPQVQHVVDGFAVPGILIDHREIAPGDEFGLLPAELGAFANSVVKVRRASGAARIVARDMCQRLGRPPCEITKAKSGMPIWPDGLVGSLAHDSRIAIAALALRHDFLSVGIDIEPAQDLDSDLLELIATANERRGSQHHHFGGRLLFTVKESIYKAVFPLDGHFLDHHDVEVCLDSCVATVSYGRVVNFRFGVASHIVALAFIDV